MRARGRARGPSESGLVYRGSRRETALARLALSWANMAPRRPPRWIAELALLVALTGCARSHERDPRAEGRDAEVGSADASAPLGRREQCNELDDDLDGTRDEGCPVRMVRAPDEVFEIASGAGRIFWTERDGDETAAQVTARVLDVARGEVRTLEGVGGGVPWLDSAGRLVTVDFARCYVRDLETGELRDVRVLPEGPDSVQQRCATEGDWLVTTGNVGVWADGDAYLHRLSTGETRRFVQEGEQEFASLHAGYAVWNHRYDPIGLWAVPVAGGDPVRLTATRAHHVGSSDVHHRPVVHGGRAMFVNECEVSLIDIATRAATVIAQGDEYCHAMSHDFDDRFAVLEVGGKLRLVDLRARAENPVHPLTTYGRGATDAHLEGDLVVWRDRRHGRWELFRMDLSDFDEGDFFPEGAGGAP